MREYSIRGLRIIHEYLPGKNKLFITGFKGYGLVGYLTTLYLAQELGCKRSGVILTRYMPEAITVDEQGLVPPFELYSCSIGDLGIIIQVNHDLPHPVDRTRFADALTLWLIKEGFMEAVYIGGFDSRYRSGEEKYKWLSTSSWTRRLGAPRMDKGLYVVGPLALLTLFSELRGIPALVLLPYAEASRPDPRAAAIAIEVLNEIYNLRVDVGKLLEEASKIEAMVQAMEAAQREQPSGAERAYM